MSEGKCIRVEPTAARRGRRTVLALGALLGVVALAAPAWAGRVVDVRVGRHAEFTRIVFELDFPAGYRIERHEPEPGIAELVVSLDAGSESRAVFANKTLIEGVELEPEGSNRSVAHIRLSRDGLRLKEMILSNPPRIVLDVMSSEPTQLAAAPKPKPAAPPAPEPVVPEEPEPPVALEPEPMEVAVIEPEMPALELLVEDEEPMLAEAPDEEPILEMDAEPVADDVFDVAMVEPEPMAAPAPTPVVQRAPPAAPARPADAASSWLSTTNLSIAGGAVLLAGVGFFLWRRRQGDEDPVMEADVLDGGDNPFASLDAEAEEAGGTQTIALPVPPGAPAVASDEPTTQILTPTDSADSPAAAEKETPMESATTAFETQSPAPPPAGTASDDVARLVRELERRVAGLESRLDEAVESREQLERQVAAQTEELRVQRAAIARTQRAVRSMSRPEDDPPTEPALRKPEA